MNERRTVRRRIATVAMAIGVVLFGIGVAPGVASAHNFTFAANCSGISWSAQSYDGGQTNSIVVTIDGAVVDSDANFGTSDSGSRTWTQTVDHAWAIDVDAPGTSFDHHVSEVWKACTPTTTSTTTTTTPPTTTTTPRRPPPPRRPHQPPCLDCTPNTNVTVPDPTTTPPSPVHDDHPAGDDHDGRAGRSDHHRIGRPTGSDELGRSIVGRGDDDRSGRRVAPRDGQRSTSLVVIALTMIGIGAVMLRLASVHR